MVSGSRRFQGDGEIEGPGAEAEPKEIWAQGREELLSILTDCR